MKLTAKEKLWFKVFFQMFLGCLGMILVSFYFLLHLTVRNIETSEYESVKSVLFICGTVFSVLAVFFAAMEAERATAIDPITHEVMFRDLWVGAHFKLRRQDADPIDPTEYVKVSGIQAVAVESLRGMGSYDQPVIHIPRGN